MLNSREVASIILLGPALVFLIIWLLRDAKVRESAWAFVLTLVTAPSLVAGAAGFYLYLAGVVWLASRVDVWDSGLMKETVLWFTLSGLGMLWSVNRVREDPHYLGTAVRHVVAATVLVEVFFQLQTFPLAVELVAQAVLLALFISEFSVRVAMERGTDTRSSDGERVAGCLSQMIATLGVAFFVATAILVVLHRNQIDWSQQGLTLAMLGWLPLAALPYIVLCSKIMYRKRG